MDINNDDAAGARNAFHMMLFDKVIESRGAVLQHSAMAEQPHDPGRAFVGVQHDRHSVVAWLVDVGDGLVAAAGQLVVPEGLAVQDAEVLAAFGRDVHVSLAGERRCADEEHLLVEDPLDEGLWCVSEGVERCGSAMDGLASGISSKY